MLHTLNYMITLANSGDKQALAKFQDISQRLIQIEGKNFLIIEDEPIPE